MRFLSLFSGIEAASAAWTPLGWTCAAVAEIEPFPCSVLAQRHPSVPNLGDVTAITEDDIEALGQLGVVVFGSPCQDLSVAGKRGGLGGERSGLFWTAMRIVAWAREHCGLRYALWENVPGAFSSNRGADFAAVVGAMAGLDDVPVPPRGWGTEGCALGSQGLVEWAVLDAQWFGVAQRRRRVFALVDFGDWSSRPPILLEPQGLRGDPPSRREARQDVAPTISARTRGGGGLGTDFDLDGGVIAFGTKEFAQDAGPVSPPPLRAMPSSQNHPNGGGQIGIAYPLISDADREHSAALTPSPDAEGRVRLRDPGLGIGGPDDPMFTLQATKPHAVVFAIQERAVCENPNAGPDGAGFRSDGAAYTLEARTVPQAVAFALRGREGGAMPEVTDDGLVNPLRAASGGSSRDYVAFDTTQITSASNYSRPKAGDPCHPLAAGAHPPAVASSWGVRRLTPTECARLQGFADDYLDVLHRGKPAADGPKYEALGNSFAVPVVRWIGARIEAASIT